MPKQVPQPNYNSDPPEYIPVNGFHLGEVSEPQLGNTPPNAITESLNMVTDREGLMTVRPLLKEFGSAYQMPGKLTGELFGFTRKSLTDNKEYSYLIGAFDNGEMAYYSNRPRTDGQPNTWTSVRNRSNTIWNADTPISFTRVSRNVQNDYLLVTGLVTPDVTSDDTISLAKTNLIGYINLYDSSWSLQTPPKLKDPLLLQATRYSQRVEYDRTAPTFTYEYAFSVSTRWGETSLSAPARFRSNYLREEWSDNNEEATIRIDIENNIKSFDPSTDITDIDATVNLWVRQMGGTWLLVDSDRLTDLSDMIFEDDGDHTYYDRVAPTSNSTIWPAAKYATVAEGRVILYGDRSNKSRIHYGGLGDDIFRFSPSSTSGNIDVSRSLDEEVISIESFLNNDNQQGLVAFTRRGVANNGNTYFLNPQVLTLADGSVASTYSVRRIEENGAAGPYGVVVYQGNIYRPSRTGFKVYGIRPSLQNFIATDDISQTIRTKALNLDYDSQAMSVGASYRQKIYWTVATQPNHPPNQLWVLDLTQGQGSWTTSLVFTEPINGQNRIRNLDFILSFTDPQRHIEVLLIAMGDKLLQLSEASDDTIAETPIKWRMKSARLFNPAMKVRGMYIVDAYLVIFNHTGGRIRIQARGRDIESEDSELATVTINPKEDTLVGSGFGFDYGSDFGTFIYTGFAGDTTIVTYPRFPVRNSCQWIYFVIENLEEDIENGLHTSVSISDIFVEYKDTGPTRYDEDVVDG